MGNKQRRSVSATPELSGRSPDGNRFGNSKNIVQEAVAKFLDASSQQKGWMLFGLSAVMA
jgi:hypothetical protein